MSSSNVGPDGNLRVYVPDEPAMMWAVSRREDGQPSRATFYMDALSGWGPDLTQAQVFVTLEYASAVAAIFPGAFPIQVLVWPPLPVTISLHGEE